MNEKVFLYVIEDQDNHIVKIGRSAEPFTTLNFLQQYSLYRLRLLYLVPEREGILKKIQTDFKRQDLGGGWYEMRWQITETNLRATLFW